MTNEQIIRDAISRSMSRNEIVNCEVSNVASDDIHDLVTATELGEWDYNEEGRVLDVFSLDSNKNEWRIKVTLW